MAKRPALTSERIIEAAVHVADERGLHAVSMRNVAAALGVEAMSLYHHIPNKNALLDALAEWLHAGITLPELHQPWREAMLLRARAMRSFLKAHAWGLNLIDSRRTPSTALLRHHDRVLGCLLENGFPLPLAVQTFAVLDAYIYGFVLTEQSVPVDTEQSADDFAAEVAPPAEQYPYLARMLADHVIGQQYVFADEFEYGLELILDGVAAKLPRSRHSPSRAPQ